ncbi:MAG TPA: AAA family ATPase [Candidatus Mediterraneibacter norfolkensis]|nr:AAA family ATPase [Candidatus Mediterraneibacter norfolkensis]
MFISELLQNRGKVNLFTRPRRFGKSLNMSMLMHFLEIGSNPDSFEGLKIMQEKELCEKYMGKFPVISISLKSVDGRSFEAASSALRRVIGNEALRFRFLSESDQLTQDDKELYNGLTTVKNGRFLITDDVLTDSLRTLSMLLSRHYGQKVILLIDEYDVLLDKAFQAGYYDEMVSLIRNMFANALKTNESLYFAVLTGCLINVAPSPPGSKTPRQVDEAGFPAKLENTSLSSQCQSIFTGLNNPKVHTISDVRYDEFFGFTDEEVDELLDFYGVTAHKEVFRDWYDGYRFGSVDVYCPWDVINYCDELLANPAAPPKNYWVNTSGNELILLLLRKADQTAKDQMEALLNGETIVKSIRQELTYRDIEDSVDNTGVCFMLPAI